MESFSFFVAGVKNLLSKQTAWQNMNSEHGNRKYKKQKANTQLREEL